ncbi:hypothetical protein Q4505_04030, partial [Pacificibacter sp. 1_MG-2023]|nr:hypothetical protein [Pacificibacter sp. 1_MG-2023]
MYGVIQYAWRKVWFWACWGIQCKHVAQRELFQLKWSGKFGQRAKVYPTRMNGYENDEATELFRQDQKWSCLVYVPVSELIYAAFRSKAKGLLP